MEVLDIREQFEFCGKDVKLYPLAKLVKPEVISIGDSSQIDDFTFIYGGLRTFIGKRVHIASFVSVIGGGEFEINDYAGLSAGVRIVTGTDKHDGSCLTNPCIPQEFRSVNVGKVKIEKHALVFSNSIVFPNVTIGEGAIVGAGAVVNRDLEPWTIYAGSACKRVGKRECETIYSLEKDMIAKYGY